MLKHQSRYDAGVISVSRWESADTFTECRLVVSMQKLLFVLLQLFLKKPFISQPCCM